ncbi:MT-A70 family methyltransferase [Ihubacter sp. rT4E-8]|uniref:MT-A70 family methyltransferase n=1 Tax=Ihubacter sp. rT4E-8 TaxID=3242369 RepID=UPI003CFB9772
MKIDIYNTNKRYKTIYIDPPWDARGGGKIKSGADRHYSLMAIAEIAEIPVENLVDPSGCHLYLWAANNYIEDALALIKKWGFEYITMITWQKDKMGLGQYYRGITEHCIFASTPKRLPFKNVNGKRQQGMNLKIGTVGGTRCKYGMAERVKQGKKEE